MQPNNNKLFYLVWHNIYIREIIINHLTILNHYSYIQIGIANVQSLKTKEATYYKSIKLFFARRNREEIIELLKWIPDNVYVVEIDEYDFNDPLNVFQFIPPTVVKFKFHNQFYSNPNDQGDITIPQKEDTIANSLKRLIFGDTPPIPLPPQPNLLVIESFPYGNIVHLNIGHFNCDFKSGSLPYNLKSFKCSSKRLISFNVDSLPLTSITELDFDQTSLIRFTSDNGKNDLSSLFNLKSVNFGQSFSDSISKGYLPNGLLILKLSNVYNPQNLKYQSIPSSVTIMFSHSFKIPSKILPLSLIKFKFGENHYLEQITNSKTQQFNNFSKITITTFTFKKSVIPSSVINLKVFGRFATPISIPVHIKTLSVTGDLYVDKPSELINLTNLEIKNHSFSNNKSNCFHANMPLKSISMHSRADQDIKLPNSLHSLSYDTETTTTTFPPLLNLLEFFSSSPIDTTLFPSTIDTLIIYHAKELLLPISPHIKTIYICYLGCYNIIQKLNLFENLHLLQTIKVINSNDINIFKKLSK